MVRTLGAGEFGLYHIKDKNQSEQLCPLLNLPTYLVVVGASGHKSHFSWWNSHKIGLGRDV